MRKNKLALCLALVLLAGATYALSACTLVRDVTHGRRHQHGGAPGTANDLATGGQGGRTGDQGGGGGSGRDRSHSIHVGRLAPRSQALDRTRPVRLSVKWRNQTGLAALAHDDAVDG